MRTIAIGDIHGCYNELKKLIDGLTNDGYYNPATDRIVFLGDYVDRGDNSREVIKYIREMQDGNDNVIALMGNHEDMLLGFCEEVDTMWLYNGYDYTIKSYIGKKEDFYSDLNWIRGLPLYFEDDYFVYVHAGINPYRKMEEQKESDLLWTRTFVTMEKDYYKRVIFGHTPTELLDGSARPFVTKYNHIDIDTGCVFGGALTAVIIDDDEVVDYYQINKEEQREAV